MVGSPRSGTTWLLNVLRSHDGVIGIDEPIIGMHLAILSTDAFSKPAWSYTSEDKRVNESLAQRPDYFFSDQYEPVWRPLLRAMILERYDAQVRSVDPDGTAICAIKEPNGSQGADILSATLPNSRLLWVARDGRDVVDSEVDAAGESGWVTKEFGGGMAWTPERRLDFVRERAYRWEWRYEIVRAAYEQHEPRLRLRVRYEDLLADPASGMDKILAWMGAGVEADRGVIERLSFDAMPEEIRGPGRFVRAATPGLWRQNLSAAEQEVLNRVCGEGLAYLGYEPA